jgi:hypothetical protein
MCLLGGCYEDVVELTLHPDGSGTLRQKLVLSERFVVATEENRGSQNVPAPNKEEIVRKIGSALEITSIKETNLPDGARVIELEGTFSEPERFFLSDYCQEQIKLRIAPAGKDNAAIYCDMKQSGGSGPNLTQLYGLAKGLHISRKVHLPAKIEKTNGYFEKAPNTVRWAIDLRNRDGLARTKGFIEGPDEGNGSAVFSASELKFTLPLKVAALPEETAAVERGKSPRESAESMGFAAKVVWVSVKKKMPTEGAGIAEMSDLEIGVELRWSEGHSPVRCEKPVLLSLLDDLNKDLVSDKAPRVHQGQVSTSEKKNGRKELTLRAETPTADARTMRQLEGYVEVITGVIEKTVVLENVQELAGRDSTGNPVLDKLNFRIKSIKGARIKVEIEGGHKRITSLDMLRDDGSKIGRSGGMGGGNEYSYDFREDISKVTKCELEVVTEESMVKVPFSLEEISLP